MTPGTPADVSVPEGPARYVELDLLTRWHATAVVVVVAIVGPVAFSHYGPLFIAASVIPLVMQIFRAFISSPVTLYRWAHAFAIVIGLCVATGSFETGGAQSPVLVFSILVGQAATTAFPQQVLWNGFPVAIVTAVVVWDWLDGGIVGNALMPTCVCIVAITAPLLVRQSLDLELSYRQRAAIDPLTGCLNRSSLLSRLGEMKSSSIRSGTSYGVIAVDVDHFKQVNDRFSHETGDKALIGVVAAIRVNLRETDVLFRTGGEEFTILAANTTHPECIQIAERIRAEVENAAIIEEPITISLGVADGFHSSQDSAIRAADQALYEAKRRGRNLVVAAADLTQPDSRNLEFVPSS